MTVKFFKAHKLSKPTDGLISRYLNRWLSTIITRNLLKRNITPNQVTIAISLLSIPMLVAGIYGSIITVGIILQLASVLDGVDGEIARTKYLTSKFGALLDTALDYWIDSLGILALGLAFLKRDMLTPPLIIFLITFTVTVRLISQFVVKMATYTRHHILRDTRDVITFLIFISCILTELISPLCIVVVFLIVNVWRLDNMIYRLFVSWKTACFPSQSEVLPQAPSGISSEIVSNQCIFQEKLKQKSLKEG